VYIDHNVRDVVFDTVIVRMSHVGTEVSERTWCRAPGAVLPPWTVPGVTPDRVSSKAWSSAVSGLLGVEAAPRPPDARSAYQPVQGAADRVDAPTIRVAAECCSDIPGPHVGVAGSREILQDLFGEFAVLLVIVTVTAGMRPGGRADHVGYGRGGGVPRIPSTRRRLLFLDTTCEAGAVR